MTEYPKQVNADAPVGVDVSSVEYSISSDLKREILNALSLIRRTDNIQSCSLNGHEIWKTVTQFDSTIDDPENKSVDEIFEFRSDVQRIEINPSGHIELKAYNKWEANLYLTFEIE